MPWTINDTSRTKGIWQLHTRHYPRASFLWERHSYDKWWNLKELCRLDNRILCSCLMLWLISCLLYIYCDYKWEFSDSKNYAKCWEYMTVTPELGRLEQGGKLEVSPIYTTSLRSDWATEWNLSQNKNKQTVTTKQKKKVTLKVGHIATYSQPFREEISSTDFLWLFDLQDPT